MERGESVRYRTNNITRQLLYDQDRRFTGIDDPAAGATENPALDTPDSAAFHDYEIASFFLRHIDNVGRRAPSIRMRARVNRESRFTMQTNRSCQDNSQREDSQRPSSAIPLRLRRVQSALAYRR